MQATRRRNHLTMELVAWVAPGLAADILSEVLVVVANNVAGGIVLADDVVAKVAMGPAAANALGALPDELGEVARRAAEAGPVPIVEGALFPPLVGPAVRRGPAAAPGDVFAVGVTGLICC